MGRHSLVSSAGSWTGADLAASMPRWTRLVFVMDTVYAVRLVSPSLSPNDAPSVATRCRKPEVQRVSEVIQGCFSDSPSGVRAAS
jgi:hypothetical protein